MIIELSNKIIYNDFIDKMLLTDDEIEILNKLILRYSIVKIADECKMSERSVSRVIHNIKIKYNNYRKMELAKLDIFNS